MAEYGRYEKGRELEEVEQKPQEQKPALDPAGMTFVDDGNGNIVRQDELLQQQQQQAPVKPTYEDWFTTVPEDRNDVTNYNLKRAYELAPYEELERWRTATPEQLQNDDSYHLKSVYFNPETGEGEFMKSKSHPTLQGELDFYNGNTPEASEFRKNYDLDTSGEYYRYVPASHLYDWKTTTPQQAIDANEHSYYDLAMDAQRWANANGQPFEATKWMGLAQNKDLQKTKEENEKEERRARRKEKLDAIGNFLTHLGNFVGAAGWGGAVKLEDPAQYTERQRRLRDATLERRNKNNMDLFTQLSRENAAAREAEIKKQRHLADLGLIGERVNATRNESEARVRNIDATTEYNKQHAETERQRTETEKQRTSTEKGKQTVQKSQANANNALAYRRRNQPFGSSRSTKTENNGKTTKTDYSKYKVNK